jgi:hypothetical protein
MNHSDREQIIESLLYEAEQLRVRKGNDYSGKEDVNSNFHRLAKKLNLKPETILWVYLTKHLDSIETYIREGKLESEPIENRIIDSVNYLLILQSLIKEKTITNPEV